MTINGIDEKDSAILELLKKDARMSFSDIGEQVGLSRVAVKNRMTALEEKGIIKGYHVEIDPMKSPVMHPFFAEFAVEPESFEEVAEKLSEDPRVITLCEVTPGGTLRAICVGDSMIDMTMFLKRYRNSYKGILRANVYEILEIKKGNILNY